MILLGPVPFYFCPRVRHQFRKVAHNSFVVDILTSIELDHFHMICIQRPYLSVAITRNSG
jgi:hypothetical protein